MNKAVFLVPVLFALTALAALHVGGALLWAIPVIAFVLIPIGDQLLPASPANLSSDEEASRLGDRFFDALLLSVVPIQVGIVVSYLWHVSHGAYVGSDWWGAFFTAGIAAGGFAINVAHELGHRREAYHQNASLILLASTLYMHFFIEHNRGHHRRVATPDDPASSQEGEWLYGFWIRSVAGSYRHAWQLENERIARQDLPWWNIENAMVRYTLIQGGLLAGVAAWLGPMATLLWVAVSVFGWLLLETINYIEHYGLQRQLNERGVYERVRPVHSWNTNRTLGRVFLFELTRHSDHHANATRAFQILRHHDDAPQLPAGYPALILLALVPPAFTRVMGPVLADWRTPTAMTD